MIRRVVGGIALACALGLPMAGCGGDDKPDPNIAWAEKVCTGIKGNTQRLSMPVVDPKNAKKTQGNIINFLTDITTQLQAQETGLRKVGKPPGSGEATYDSALANLAKLRTELEGVVAGLKKTKVTDQKSLTRALGSYQKTMSAFQTYQGPAKELQANAELGGAFTENAACKGI